MRSPFQIAKATGNLAADIAQGRRYEFAESRAFRTPGYPLLLSPLFVAFGAEPPVMAARWLGAVLGTVVVWGVGVFGMEAIRRTSRSDRGAFLRAVPRRDRDEHPCSQRGVVLPVDDRAVVLLVDRHAIQIAPTDADVRSALAGVAAGLATLTRPSWLLFTPLAILVAVVFSSTSEDAICALAL